MEDTIVVETQLTEPVEEKVKKIAEIPEFSYAGKAVKACKIKARGMMGDELVSFRLLDFVTLMLLNNKFASKGIFITDDNKEECYIKIIEMGNEDDINDLEKFINIKDEIKVLEKKKQEYLSIINQLQLLQNPDDEDAVNTIIEDYLRR